MKNEFVSYEHALALLELGFDGPCFAYYNMDPSLRTPSFNMTKPFAHEWCLSTPTFSQAFRFFREKYELHSFIYSDYTWNISGGIWDIYEHKDLRYDWDSEVHATYEEAEKSCLEELIKIVKTNDLKSSNKEFEEIDLTCFEGYVYENSDYCWEATRVYIDDVLNEAIDVKFTDKTTDEWKEEHWDNMNWFKAVHRNDPEAIAEAKLSMNIEGVTVFQKFISALVEKKWLVI